jgi:hypothetical protein
MVRRSRCGVGGCSNDHGRLLADIRGERREEKAFPYTALTETHAIDVR